MFDERGLEGQLNRVGVGARARVVGSFAPGRYAAKRQACARRAGGKRMDGRAFGGCLSQDIGICGTFSII